MKYDRGSLFVYGEDRVAVECTVISQFKNEDTGKHYIVYTDGSRNELGKKNLFVASYNPDDDADTALTPVESLEEWEQITDFLSELRTIIDEQGLDL